MTQNSAQNIAIQLHDVVKRFGSVTALDGVSFSIEDREFFTLLGPSGCGKTTLLRLIAGFEGATEGEIELHGQNISHLPPNKRPVNTVFQQYSLFPHMTVAENVRFGLQMKGSDTAHLNKRAAQMLELVQLQELADRKPAQLSGGQQQRVALARALAPEPEVLLLDEPLSALDLKLRQAMRLELKRIQQDAGITFIFVTHDQEEALTMSDRIAVMSNGLVQQIGPAETIYEQPANAFVANFIGETNLLTAKAIGEQNGIVHCQLGDGTTIECTSTVNVSAGQGGQVCIRPERLLPVENPASVTQGVLSGTVEQHVYLGTDIQFRVKLNAGENVQVRMPVTAFSHNRLQVGDSVSLSVDQNSALFFT